MLHTLLMIVHIVSATCIVALVLVQRGKGADAGAGFGAGASGTVFGARGATTALSRATAVLAALFMVTSLALSYVVTRDLTPAQSELERLATEGAESEVPIVPSSDALPADAPPVVLPADDATAVPQGPQPAN
jgi:preprotein translocase subunit SecG